MAKSREKFVDLAQNRVARVIKDLRLIGNLSNKSNYEYSIDDVEKIMSTLKSELSKTQKKIDLAASNKKIFSSYKLNLIIIMGHYAS